MQDRVETEEAPCEFSMSDAQTDQDIVCLRRTGANFTTSELTWFKMDKDNRHQ